MSPNSSVYRFACLTTALLVATIGHAQTPAQPDPTLDDIYRNAQQLFDQLAPPEVKAQFEFPSREKWDELWAGFQRALEGDSLEELARYAPEARGVLSALRAVPGYEDLADWLTQRLDELEGAQQITAPEQPPRPAPGKPAKTTLPAVPHYDVWLARVRGRPLPARAAALMPRLRAAFASEGVPPEIAWLAEAESSLNPNARSPVGAKGLFQFMPETAKAAGLSTFLPDERTDPEKSAHAAARNLHRLYRKFGNWALVFAAYNAGEGRVSRALAQRGAKTFTAIAEALPAETRMYVPKVCALIETRAGIPPHQIGRPVDR